MAKTPRKKKTKPEVEPLGYEEDSWWPWRTVFTETSEAGETVTPETSLRVSTVAACVRVIAETVATLPVHIYERMPSGRKRYAADNDLNYVLRTRPNPWQTPFEFFELMTAHCALRGNSYALIYPGAYGATSELWPLHPSRMSVERLENNSLRYTYTEPNGKKTAYRQDEIFHLRWTSFDGLMGASPITVASNPIGLAMATDKYGAKYFKNGSKPGGILTTDNPLDKKQREGIKSSWQDAHSGADNAHKVAVLSSGMKWQAIGVSNDDGQFLETRKFQVADIARIFRVPLHMIGDLDRATFSNIEAQGIEFVNQCIGAWVSRWEQAIVRDLISDDERYYAKFNVDALKRGDSAARSSFYQGMINTGVLTINEAREFEELDPVEGGDTILVQGAMMPLDRILNPPEPAEPPIVGQMSARLQRARVRNEDVIKDRIERMLAIEIKGVQKLADNPAKFLDGLESFYTEHRIKLADSLKGPLLVHIELGEPYNFSVDDHIAESKKELLWCYDNLPANQFSVEVNKRSSNWTNRIKGL